MVSASMRSEFKLLASLGMQCSHLKAELSYFCPPFAFSPLLANDGGKKLIANTFGCYFEAQILQECLRWGKVRKRMLVDRMLPTKAEMINRNLAKGDAFVGCWQSE